ncbi:MAG: glycine--tRNA ligase subunit beta, partial [Holosporales bacterium]
MAELLFGIVIEEIPARMQIHGMTQFKALVERLFREANLSWSRIEVFVTPRRITLWVEGLPQNLPAVTQQRKGPRIDAPEEAQRGFFQSVGLTPAQCQTLETPKGTFWVADV